ncbi:glutamate-rich 6-like [Brachionus plicatilis]|uniref:Glutamate-rich 6-like n=1 Tax=Brachionus plicatilis TaxID=10195 RepID=A0A3M7QAW1_BRAPC|nr:glutamate-rich 6-like [Brachionus plicatilis]
MVLQKDLKNLNIIVEKDQIKEESEKTFNLGEPLSNVVSFKSSEEKAKDKINYSLSNREFIEQGWTVLYKNAPKKNQKETEPEPQRDRNISVFDLVEKIPMQFTKTSYKYYNNGSLFELMLSDQTGTIYYPNGNIAIVISIFGNFRSFIAFSDQDKNSIPLAYFDSNGNGFCNYCSGKLRYQLNHYGAINFDENGKCIRRWLWPSESKMNTFRPVISRLNDYMSIKMFTRDRIVFCFRSKQSSCKFIVSTKTENPDKKFSFQNSKKKFEHFKNTISDPECKKLREKSDLLLKILAKGFPSNLEEEKLKNLIKDQEDTFYVKLPKIKNSKPASIVSRISFNHSSVISTERDKLSLDSVSKKGFLDISKKPALKFSYK